MGRGGAGRGGGSSGLKDQWAAGLDRGKEFKAAEIGKAHGGKGLAGSKEQEGGQVGEHSGGGPRGREGDAGCRSGDQVDGGRDEDRVGRDHREGKLEPKGQDQMNGQTDGGKVEN